MHKQLIDLSCKLISSNIHNFRFEILNGDLSYTMQLETHYSKEENEYFFDPQNDFRLICKILSEFRLKPKMFQCEISDENQILFGELESL